MTDKDIETLINDNIAGSGVSVKVKISGSGSIDLSLKLDKSTKDKIKQELLAGPLKDLDGLTDGYLSEKLDSIISTLEEHLNYLLHLQKLHLCYLCLPADGSISKFRDLLNLKRSDIEKALYDVVKDKLGEQLLMLQKVQFHLQQIILKKAYKYVAASAEAKLKSCT